MPECRIRDRNRQLHVFLAPFLDPLRKQDNQANFGVWFWRITIGNLFRLEKYISISSRFTELNGILVSANET